MTRTSTKNILCLLPKIWKGEEFGKVWTNEGCSRDYTSRNITPVGSIQAISYCCRLRSYSRSKRCLITSWMTPQNKVESIKNRFFREHLGIGRSKEIVLKSETLNIPACSPYRRLIRHSIRSLVYHFIKQLTICL